MANSSNPSSPIRGDRVRVSVVIGTAALLLLLAEWGSSRLTAIATSTAGTSQVERPKNVTVILKDPASLPPAKDLPSVWVLGNSHTFALPGLKKGDPLRDGDAGILIDELSVRVGRDYADPHADFYLLSYPNFLPFEMLTRVGHLIYHKHRPTIVFIGITWRNIARDTQLRHEILGAYRDLPFVDAFVAMLNDPAIEANPEVVQEVEAQRRRAEHEEELERLRSDSDHIDEKLTNWVSARLALMGKSSDLRATIFRTLTDRVQRQWDDRQGVTYSYDLVEHDYEFNVECLRSMVRLLKQHGATVFCYYAPERTDLPPLMDPDKQHEFIERTNREAQELGITMLDARGVVPNEYWGWVGDSPDRSHFTEVGHQRLAQFLLEEAAKQSAWKELSRP